MKKLILIISLIFLSMVAIAQMPQAEAAIATTWCKGLAYGNACFNGTTGQTVLTGVKINVVDILLNGTNITSGFYTMNETDYLLSLKLNVTDQRYNDTAAIESVNNSLINYLLITDQRYNDTALINAVNTTGNIQSLGFNTTSELDLRFYSITNPNAFINASQLPPPYNDSAIYAYIAGVNTTSNIMSLGFYNTSYIDTNYFNTTASDARYLGGGYKIWYFTNQTADVAGMKYAQLVLPNSTTPVASTTVDNIPGNAETNISYFITPANTPPYVVLEGLRQFYMTARISSAVQATQLKGYVYTTNSTGGNLTLLRSSTLSLPLSTVNAEYYMDVGGHTWEISNETRILFVISAVRTGALNTYDITLSYDSDTFSRLQVPSPVGVTDLSALIAADAAQNARIDSVNASLQDEVSARQGNDTYLQSLINNTQTQLNSSLNNVTKINFNTNPVVNATEGDLYWDSPYKTLTLKGDRWELQIGQELYIIVYNDKSTNFIDGQAVYIDGATGGYPTIDLAQANTLLPSGSIGITTQTIMPGETGMITIHGLVHGLNTSSSVPGEVMYLSPFNAGELTSILPTYPNYAVPMGISIVQDELNGDLFVHTGTSETDPIWGAEKVDYYNSSYIDSLIYGSLKNTSLTDEYIPYFINGSLVDSPISRIITDEDKILFYDGDIYVDDTNGMVGINVPDGEPQAYNQAFTVQSKTNLGSGTITIHHLDYDNYSTGVSSTNVLPESFVDAGTITIHEIARTFYIYEVVNSTYFRIRGTTGADATSSNWSWQQAPYIDVNGPANTERGYTISSDGQWQWAMLIPDDSNNTQFCIQNRNAWFGGNNNALCISTDGSTTINGELTAENLNIGNSTLEVGGVIAPFINTTTIYLNNTNLQDLLDNKVNVSTLGEYYNKTETDNLLNNKLNVTDQRYNDTLAIETLSNTTLHNSGIQTLNGSLIINGYLAVVGSYVNLTVTQQNINGSIYPMLGSTFDLGAPGQTWQTVYADNLHGTLNASDITNAPWLLITDQRYNDTAAIQAVNNSLANYLLITDQRYNDTLLIQAVNTSLENSKLNVTDQRYNDTAAISLKLNITDQRYNDTLLIQAVNTSLENSKLNVTDQRYNETDWVIAQAYFNANSLIPHTAGFITSTNPIDNGDGTLTISSQEVNLYSNQDGSGVLKKYTVIGGTTGSTLPAIPQGISYLIGDYNGGTPIFNVVVDNSNIHWTNRVPYITLFRTGNDVETLTWDGQGNALAEKLTDRDVRTDRFVRESGLAISEGTNRTIIVSEGVAWVGSYRKIINESNSNTSGQYYYHNGTDWLRIPATQYDNLHYDNGTGLALVGAGNFTISWVYSSLETIPEMYFVLGTAQYESLASAILAPYGAVPPEVSTMAILVGRIAVEQGASTADISSAFTTTLLSSSVANHNDLSGLQGGGPGDYYHMTGAQIQANMDRTLVYKADSNARIAGINSLSAGKATFQVTTVWVPRNGKLTTIDYNVSTDLTTLAISDDTTYGFDASAYINVSGNLYYVTEVLNTTAFVVEGNLSVVNASFSVKQSAYIDVFAGPDDEHGFSISDQDGNYQWAMYVARGYNFSRLCWANVNSPLVGGDTLCINDDGTLESMGQIFEEGVSLNVKYNDTALINAVNTTGNIQSLGFNTTTQLNNLYLAINDQRYNDTAKINAVNTTGNIQSLGFNTTTQLNNLYLAINDQRYNDTAKINAVNTTANIQSLGFNTTTQLNNLYYSITNPNGFLNATGVVNAVGNFSAANSTLARTGNCPAGQYVVNTTTGGVQCAIVTAAGDGTGGWTNTSTTTSTSLDVNINGSMILRNGEFWNFWQGQDPRIILGDNETSYGYLGWDSGSQYYRIETDGTNGLKVNDNFVSIGDIYPGKPLIVANGTLQLFAIDTNLVNISVNTNLNNKNLSTTGVINSRGTYAEMQNSTAGGTIVMTTQNLWYNISGMALGQNTVGSLISGYRLDITEAGTYAIEYNVNGAVNNNDVIGMRLTVNNVAEAGAVSNLRYSTNLINQHSFRTYLTLATGDIITLQIQDQTRNGATYTYTNRVVTLNKIGN